MLHFLPIRSLVRLTSLYYQVRLTYNPSKMHQQKNVLVAVAWPYVNGDLHIGHLAGYLLPADICARYHRLIGNNVLMVSGSDCHGTPITVEADKRGKSPQAIADEYHTKDVELFENILKLSYDCYTRTDTQHHAQVTQDFFIKLLEAGYISILTTEQYYSEDEQRFLPDRYIEGVCPFCGYSEARSDQCDNCGKLIEQGELINPTSKISQTQTILRETEHYFVDWANLQPPIARFVERNGGKWKRWVRHETEGWLKEGLKSRPITRDIDWGVAIPIDRIPPEQLIDNAANKRFYVWFDAVIGYLSASLLWAKENHSDWRPFWYDQQAAEQKRELVHYYFMGKDNLVFHTMFWPGKLIVYDEQLHLPDVESINMFLNFDGAQFSKSRGVVVDSKAIVEQYGNDPVRFYLTYVMPENNDSSFSWDDFTEKVNSILIGNVGNFIHRVLSIAQGTDLSQLATIALSAEVDSMIRETFTACRQSLDASLYRPYLNSLLELSSAGNKKFDHAKVWALKKNNPAEFNRQLYELLTIIIALGYLSQPLLIESSPRIFQLLGVSEPPQWPEPTQETEAITALLNEIPAINKPKPLFEKIESHE